MNTGNSYPEIFEALHSRHFGNSGQFSNVTSSYWQSVGTHEVAKDQGGRWTVKGHAFGYFRSNSIRNTIRFFFELILTRRLLTIHKCDPKIAAIGSEIAKRSRRLYDYDCVKQVLALDTIVKHISFDAQPAEGTSNKIEYQTACVIGDG